MRGSSLSRKIWADTWKVWQIWCYKDLEEKCGLGGSKALTPDIKALEPPKIRQKTRTYVLTISI